MIFYNFDDMKAGTGDYEDQRNKTSFAKFHHHTLTQKLESHSDDAEVDSQPAPVTDSPTVDIKKQKKLAEPGAVGTTGDGSSIEVVRRPRGRPPGSKNKPKPPVVITRDAADSHDVMRPHVLEVSAGQDVGDALARFTRRRNVGISVLAGTGLVSNVTLRQPSISTSATTASSPASTFTFHGRFEILSISATFFPPSFSATSPGLSVSLAGPHGQIVGGAVTGPLVAAGTVTVVAAAFINPSFHRLPMEDDNVSLSVSGDADTATPIHHHEQQQRHGGVAAALTGASLPAESSGMPISTSCHLLSDVIWAPMARAPHPPPY